MKPTRIRLGAGPPRAAESLPNVTVADRVARDWGEAVWTCRSGYVDEVLEQLSVLRATRLRELGLDA